MANSLSVSEIDILTVKRSGAALKSSEALMTSAEVALFSAERGEPVAMSVDLGTALRSAEIAMTSAENGLTSAEAHYFMTGLKAKIPGVQAAGLTIPELRAGAGLVSAEAAMYSAEIALHTAEMGNSPMYVSDPKPKALQSAEVGLFSAEQQLASAETEVSKLGLDLGIRMPSKEDVALPGFGRA